MAQTRVQFHQDQTQVLVVHETQIAIYEGLKLRCIKQVRNILVDHYLLSILFDIMILWSQVECIINICLIIMVCALNIACLK